MKYYLYISDTKVDMLYAQIPQNSKYKISKELKIDLKILSTSFKEIKSEETRYSKLKIVIDFIEKNLNIGTIDNLGKFFEETVHNPSDYFKGTLPMKWGPSSYTSDTVFFGCSDKGNYFIGLGGSSKHVIGNRGTGASLVPSSSTTSHLLSVIKKELQLLNIENGNSWENEDFALENVYYFTKNMNGPTQQIEFLARNLLQGYTNDHEGDLARVIFGTPIYVAIADSDNNPDNEVKFSEVRSKKGLFWK